MVIDIVDTNLQENIKLVYFFIIPNIFRYPGRILSFNFIPLNQINQLLSDLKESKISFYILAIYIVLIGLQEPYHFPWFEGKIQWSDVWFLIMLGYVIFNRTTLLPIFKNLNQDKRILWFLCSCLIYISINALSVFNSYSHSGLFELLGKCYLLTMSIVVLLLLLSMNTESIPKSIFLHFNIFGFSSAIIGIIGWTYSIFGFHNETTQIYFDYPYFGDTHRLKTFTTTPSMYISMITICIVFSVTNHFFYEKNKFQLFSSIFFTISALLTFTKSFLFIIAVWFILVSLKYFRKPVLIVFTFLCFVILQVVLTHFLIISTKQSNEVEFINSPYTSNELMYSTKDYSVVGSGYYTFKKTAWKLFQEFPLIGLGPGNYNQQVMRLKEEGCYPKNLPNFDPHSTFLGALAETGMIGFISLMLLGLSILFFFSKMEVKSNPFSFSLLLIFCIMIVEGISMDTMNFRHYWVVVSLILFQYWNINAKKEVMLLV